MPAAGARCWLAPVPNCRAAARDLEADISRPKLGRMIWRKLKPGAEALARLKLRPREVLIALLLTLAAAATVVVSLTGGSGSLPATRQHTSPGR